MSEETPEGNLPTYLKASGGWCAPGEVVYDFLMVEGGVIQPPTMTARRGGFTFPQPGSPEWEEAQRGKRVIEAMQAQITRLVGDVVQAQNAAIEVAWLTSDEDQAVHVYPPAYDHYPPAYYRGIYRFVGISVEPGLRAIHQHDAGRSAPYGWDDDDDWD